VPGSYLTIGRNWKDGDMVELRMPFKFYLEPVMDQQNIASLFYGPVLLAAQETEPGTEWRKVTLNAKDMSKSVSGDRGQLLFNIDGVVFNLSHTQSPLPLPSPSATPSFFIFCWVASIDGFSFLVARHLDCN